MPHDQRPSITPEMKVAQLLEYYPELEPRLLDMSPAFSRLRNPVLRRTIARVTSLRQAATVGGVELGHLVNALRREVGESALESQDGGQDDAGAQPAWLQTDRIHHRTDIRPILAAGEKPIGKVLADLSRLPMGRVYELKAPFVPAPLIDIAREKGIEVWWRKEDAELVKVFFCRPSDTADDSLVSLG